MTAFLVLNELSTEVLAPDQTTGKRYLDQLSEVLIDPRIKGHKTFVTAYHFPRLHVSAGFSVGRWLAEYSPADREKRLRLKTLLDRSIEFGACLPADQMESEDVEYRFAGQAARGLAIALLVDGLAVSFWSDEQWNLSRVAIEKTLIIKDDIETHAIDVQHACRVAHLDDHREWLLRVQAPSPADGLQLWNDREQQFPSLLFCDSAEQQIKALGGNEPRFKAVARGLRDLQNYCDNWDTGHFDIHKVPHASGESGPTLNMYGEERKFRCPDGQYRLFEWHLKRGDTRIHFLDLPADKRILVGYVGAHLRISSQ